MGRGAVCLDHRRYPGISRYARTCLQRRAALGRHSELAGLRTRAPGQAGPPKRPSRSLFLSNEERKVRLKLDWYRDPEIRQLLCRLQHCMA